MKMIPSLVSVQSLLLICLLVSCDDNLVQHDNKAAPSAEKVDTVQNGDVFISGMIDNKAVYWENKVAKYLQTVSPTSYAEDIIFNEGEIFVAGVEGGRACYWKRGELNILGERFPGRANGIAFKADKMYIVGSVFDSTLRAHRAVYWKNDQIFYLADSATATDICVVGGDVYISGVINSSACYWKNGKLKHLTPKKTSTTYRISAIEEDFYITGFVKEHINASGISRGYWKGEGFIELGENDIVVNMSGSDGAIVGAGIKDNVACMWVDGKPVKLSSTKKSEARAIEYLREDCYVAGVEYDSQTSSFVAGFWKNGHWVALGKPNSFATSMTVVPR